jgi:hypothetical protein
LVLASAAADMPSMVPALTMVISEAISKRFMLKTPEWVLVVGRWLIW